MVVASRLSVGLEICSTKFDSYVIFIIFCYDVYTQRFHYFIRAGPGPHRGRGPGAWGRAPGSRPGSGIGSGRWVPP